MPGRHVGVEITWLEVYHDYSSHTPNRACPKGAAGPASPWEAPGVRVGAASGTRGVREAGAVGVANLAGITFRSR